MNPSPVSFRHLRRLTDDTGLAEHAVGVIPARKEGYSTDDQARGLWACLEWLDLTEPAQQQGLYELIDVYLSFLMWAQRDDGHFHNNFGFDRRPEAETPSDDCLGRCLWAGALAVVKLQDESRAIAAEKLVAKALTRVDGLKYPRGIAYALAAVSLLHRHNAPYQAESIAERLAAQLIASYRAHSGAAWRWYEPMLSYSNGVMPWGLLCAFDVLKREEILAVATESLDFLIAKSVNDRKQIRPVGNRGWCTPEHRAQWDQQPVDVFKLLLAAAQAYEITGEAAYRDAAERCRQWFYGDNDCGVPLIDEREGACRDGLGPDGASLNKGAESTLSYLLAEAVYRKRFGSEPEHGRQTAAGMQEANAPL